MRIKFIKSKKYSTITALVEENNWFKRLLFNAIKFDCNFPLAMDNKELQYIAEFLSTVVSVNNKTGGIIINTPELHVGDNDINARYITRNNNSDKLEITCTIPRKPEMIDEPNVNYSVVVLPQ